MVAMSPLAVVLAFWAQEQGWQCSGSDPLVSAAWHKAHAHGLGFAWSENYLVQSTSSLRVNSMAVWPGNSSIYISRIDKDMRI